MEHHIQEAREALFGIQEYYELTPIRTEDDYYRTVMWTDIARARTMGTQTIRMLH